jgi:hypothetical protein
MNQLPSAASSSVSFIAGQLSWLRRHLVFSLLTASAGSALLSAVLLFTRKAITGQGRLGFIPFNLILAFIALAFLLLFERSQKRGHAILCSVLWLLFFPMRPTC